MEERLSKDQAMDELKKGYAKADILLQDKSKVDKLLQRIENKLKSIPKIGEKLSHVPVFIQLIKCYITKEYTIVPLGSVISIISALLYLANPFDLIPDFIPVIGYLDDIAVIGICFSLVESDINEFIRWRDRDEYIIF